MKPMILTGLATEQSFDNLGAAQFYLIFNGGELRVPVSEEAAQVVAQAMVDKTPRPAPSNGHTQPVPPAMEDPDGMLDEDGIAQV